MAKKIPKKYLRSWKMQFWEKNVKKKKKGKIFLRRKFGKKNCLEKCFSLFSRGRVNYWGHIIRQIWVAQFFAELNWVTFSLQILVRKNSFWQVGPLSQLDWISLVESFPTFRLFLGIFIAMTICEKSNGVFISKRWKNLKQINTNLWS